MMVGMAVRRRDAVVGPVCAGGSVSGWSAWNEMMQCVLGWVTRVRDWQIEWMGREGVKGCEATVMRVWR